MQDHSLFIMAWSGHSGFRPMLQDLQLLTNNPQKSDQVCSVAEQKSADGRADRTAQNAIVNIIPDMSLSHKSVPLTGTASDDHSAVPASTPRFGPTINQKKLFTIDELIPLVPAAGEHPQSPGNWRGYPQKVGPRRGYPNTPGGVKKC